MCPAGETATDRGIEVPPALDALLARLEALSLEPAFRPQREEALGMVLRGYLEYGARVPLPPLPEELEQAKLYVYADYYPEDGQFSLIEQVRDTITTHVPEEERAWLDPLRHSAMDLLEVVEISGKGPRRELRLRSLGDGRIWVAREKRVAPLLEVGQVLVARLVHPPDEADPARVVLVGGAIVLGAARGLALFEAVERWRRELEAGSGAFNLGEWEEFTKRFGYIFLWQVAQARLEALAQAIEAVRFVTPDGSPFLYALGLYDHHEYRVLSEGMAQIEGLQANGTAPLKGADQETPDGESVRRWVLREGPASGVVARLTLSPVQVLVECDSGDRLDELKHQLASTFRYSLHFRGESTRVPAQGVPEVDLTTDKQAQATVVVEPEEEHGLLSAFLESVYLEWADLPSPALDDQTPRHAATVPSLRDKVAVLIDQVERNDPARRRTGKPGYDFNRLREHVGLL